MAGGERITHQPSRTVTGTDNLMFSAMTHNMQPLHLDAETARASEYGQILVNSCFTFRHELTNQRGEVALSCLRTVLLRSSPQ